MNLESPKVTLEKSSQEVFDLLSTVSNFEKLMPENNSKFEAIGDNAFIFGLAGMPDITLEIKENIAPSKIVLGAVGDKLPFTLVANITAIAATSSEVYLEFEGEFNPMMAMMIKGPIEKFIGTLAGNMVKL